ncbi:MAG: pre-peptidase C-terminal domain-containing protein [Acidobacteria bacterium]|nr:pre-peptidase C-terminal domain-containing protein [Acidobacteriota bacterium]
MQRFALLAILAGSLLAFANQSEDQVHSDYRLGLTKLEFVSKTDQAQPLVGESLAWQYIAEHFEKYGLPSNLDNLRLNKEVESLIGFHYHFDQFLGDYRVKTGEIIVSISKETGNVYMVYNNTYPVLDSKRAPDSTVSLETEDAYDIAWQDMKVHGDLIQKPMVDLVWLAENGSFRLVYETLIGVEAPFGYWKHQIDAHTGEILNVEYAAIAEREVTADFSAYKGPVDDRAASFARFEARERAAQKQEVQANKAAGSAKVFDPDPVTTLQNSSLQDTSSASSFTSAYFTRTLQDITLSSGTYSLTGPWVKITNFESPNTAPSTTTNGSWTATRGNNAFNDVMTYFHIDQSQRYMQSLGFSGSNGIQYLSINVDSDGLNGDDNSHFIPSTNRLAFGHGCVDDNEDQFVILHEYGHAINHSINSNFSGGDTGAMGEGFGDYWAGSYKYSTPNGPSFHPEWAFPWDGHNNCWGGRYMDKTSAQYNHSTTYGAHQSFSGFQSDELWSTPIFQALVTLTGQGVPRSQVDKIILQAQFGLGSGLKMRDMANAIVSTAQTLYPSGNHASVFTAKFVAQGILTGTTPPPTGATKLNNNQTVSSLSGAQGSQVHYYISVPSGASNLKVTTTGGSGDMDLYVKQGGQASTSSYTAKSTGGTSAETVTIASPAASDYYIMLYGYTAYSGVSMTVSYQTSTGGGTVTETFTGTVGGRKSVYHNINVTGNGQISLNLTWNNSTDLDLYIISPSGSTVASATSTSKPETLTYNTNGVTGTFRIRVYNYTRSTSATYTLTATHP